MAGVVSRQDGRFLAYVIRDIIVPLESAEVPLFREEESAYGSMQDEIQARSPHGIYAYCVDNATALEMLNAANSEHKNSNTWIKSFAIGKDGREAWIAFK
jgi:hypothetical protein